MKKLLIALAVSLFAFTGKGQVWLDLGAKGGYTPGLSINTNVFNDDMYKTNFTSSYLFGGKIGVNFNPEHAVAVEVLFTTLNNSKTLTNGDLVAEFDLSQTYIEIPILYRFNKENGGYSEIGPQIGLFQGATLNDVDVKEQFNKTNFGLALGFGQYIGGGNMFGLNLGFRMAYMFNDIIGKDFQTETGNAVYQPVISDPSEFTYKGSTNFYAGIVAEFNFNLGYFVKGSGCKKNTRFKLF